MGGAERIVFALVALRKTGESATLAQRANAVAPAGQDLVRIGLVPDIPDDAIIRRVEQIMQRHRQLDDAESGAQVTAGHGHRADGLRAQLVGNLPEVFLLQAAQIGNCFPADRR